MNKIITLAVAFLLFIPFASINGNNVSLTNNTNGNILYVGGSGPNNYTSIQSAINDADNGYTIYVYAGIYREHVRIYKPINLIGEDEKTTIIDGMNETDVMVFSITADHVNFSHFTIRNISGGEWTFGIKIENGNHIEISNCIIKDCDGIGIFSTDNISIENCNISHNYWGIDIRGGNNIDIKNCTISYNPGKKDDNGWVGGFGISADGVSTRPISNIYITNCSICHNGNTGIDILDIRTASNVHISDCYVNSNGGKGGDGIWVSGGNISISNCSISNSSHGIMIASDNATIEKCVITNNYNGIIVMRKDKNIHITKNNIENNTYGIYVWAMARSIFVNYNNIFNNGIGMKAEFSVCNARNNYWGSPFGPSHLFGLRGDKIQATLAKVFYFPWLEEEYELG